MGNRQGWKDVEARGGEAWLCAPGVQHRDRGKMSNGGGLGNMSRQPRGCQSQVEHNYIDVANVAQDDAGSATEACHG